MNTFSGEEILSNMFSHSLSNELCSAQVANSFIKRRPFLYMGLYGQGSKQEVTKVVCSKMVFYCTCICNTTSDWIMRKICKGKFYNLLSESRHHHIMWLSIGCYLVLRSSLRLKFWVKRMFFKQNKWKSALEWG